MKKQSIDKLILLLSGVNSRHDEQKEYFISLEFSFISGSKSFNGSYNCNNQFIFLGENVELDFHEVIDRLIIEVQKYDSINIKYIQRGTILIIEADDKKVISRSEEYVEEIKKEIKKSIFHNRDYYIKSNKASDLLKEIGIMTDDGKIKNDMIRKYNQIDYFVEIIDSLLVNFKENKSITILDSACGKSYLSFVLNYYIKDVLKKDCIIIGVDYKDNVIKASKERAKVLKYNNMEFIKEDLRTYTPDKKIDMVISLHACDIATDYAIALAIRCKAKSLIIVPCCHKELKEQIICSEINPLIKHGLFKARFNDFLTDSLRSLFIESYGYEVTPIEYISPIDSPKNLMLKAIKKTDSDIDSYNEYNKMKKLFNVNPTMEKHIF